MSVINTSCEFCQLMSGHADWCPLSPAPRNLLPQGPPVRSDYERALERIRELETELASSEEERLKACERAGNLQLRLDESLAREGALNTRLSNLDTLARDILVRVEKMTSALDR